jgi:hypothetical protein
VFLHYVNSRSKIENEGHAGAVGRLAKKRLTLLLSYALITGERPGPQGVMVALRRRNEKRLVQKARSDNTIRHTTLSFQSLLTTGFARRDETPQKIGKSIGNSFFQHVAIVLTKAVADLDQSFSPEFFCLIRL